MSETNSNVEEQKVKTCRLAVWSMVLGLIGFLSVFVLALSVHQLALLGLIICLTGIVLGIKALVEIQRSKGVLKGKILAICGILICIIGPILGIYVAGKIFFSYGHEVF